MAGSDFWAQSQESVLSTNQCGLKQNKTKKQKKKETWWDWRDIVVSSTQALHVTDTGSNPSTLYDFPTSCQKLYLSGISNKSWAQLNMSRK